MEILKLIFFQYRQSFLWISVLTLSSGMLGIATLNFINSYLLRGTDIQDNILWKFTTILIVYFVFSLFAQILLAKLGQRFVCDLRSQILKRALDAEENILQKLGKARLLASLSIDTRNISMAFTTLPNVVQGVLFSLGSCLYLAYLSPALFSVCLVWFAAMIVGSLPMTRRTHKHFTIMRRTTDQLYTYYESALSGHKELLLNCARAARYFHDEFEVVAEKNRQHHILADGYSALTNNWNNVLMFAAVGNIFYLCAYKHWASLADATTFSMAVLFVRGPVLAAISAFPVLIQSKVSLRTLQSFELPPYKAQFSPNRPLTSNWKTITLRSVTYTYPNQSSDIFSLTPINLTLNRGEIVFLVGANGSGKSTLCLLLTGLYPPSSGEIYVDDVLITHDNRAAYRQLFSSVFTEFHLFPQLITHDGTKPSTPEIAYWLSKLKLDTKAIIDNARIVNHKLSQGQKKRLALLSAILENRHILILDEWAADQDPNFRRYFYETLLFDLKAAGFSVFAISHDEKYFAHADRILVMREGQLTEVSVKEACSVINSPCNASDD